MAGLESSEAEQRCGLKCPDATPDQIQDQIAIGPAEMRCAMASWDGLAGCPGLARIRTGRSRSALEAESGVALRMHVRPEGLNCEIPRLQPALHVSFHVALSFFERFRRAAFRYWRALVRATGSQRYGLTSALEAPVYFDILDGSAATYYS